MQDILDTYVAQIGVRPSSQATLTNQVRTLLGQGHQKAKYLLPHIHRIGEICPETPLLIRGDNEDLLFVARHIKWLFGKHPDTAVIQSPVLHIKEHMAHIVEHGYGTVVRLEGLIRAPQILDKAKPILKEIDEQTSHGFSTVVQAV